MSNLGSFGAAVRELNPNDHDTFDFFGEKFTVTGVMPSVLMLQLGASTTGKIDDQEGLGAIWEAMRCSLSANGDDSQFVRWYRLAVSECCDLESLIKLAMALFEAQTGRPTGEPQGSSTGDSSTSPSLNGSSTQHPAFAHLKPVESLVNG